jgi:hypothetical protein
MEKIQNQKIAKIIIIWLQGNVENVLFCAGKDGNGNASLVVRVDAKDGVFGLMPMCVWLEDDG